MILGLDAPTGGTATATGVPFRSHARGLHHVGALLDGHQVHGGRSARSHLSALVASNDSPYERGPGCSCMTRWKTSRLTAVGRTLICFRSFYASPFDTSAAPSRQN
ncbi:hypothetical protein OHA58_06065 [Streptomyces sp. NBC_00009]